jgi:uncharacterized DUF497 family protein
VPLETQPPCHIPVGTNGRTKAIGSSTEFGLKRPRAFLAIRMDPYFYDPEHSEHEDRFILLGVSSAARTLIVVHCYKENDSVVRIISARKATRKEVRFYEEGI